MTIRRVRGGGSNRSLGRFLGAGLVLALVGTLAGCQRGDANLGLKGRADKYWSLKQAKAWDEVYDKYLDPPVKEQLSKAAFLKRRLLAFDILSYEISNVQETEDKATVEVTNTVNFPLKAPDGELKLIKKQVSTKDNWVRRDGNWYIELTE